MSIQGLYTTNSIISRDVITRENTSIGRVEQIQIDAENAVVRFLLVVPFSGHNRLIPVPWELVRLSDDGRSVLVDASDEVLLSAPTLERNAKAYPAGTSARDIYDHYGIPERSVSRVNATGEAPPARGNRHSSAGFWVAGFVVALLVVAGVAYFYYDPGAPQSTASVREAASEAAASVEQASSDMATTVKVKTALALSKAVSADDISVDTEHNVVTLRGTVASERIRDLAQEIAANTSGVRGVRNHLTVGFSGAEARNRPGGNETSEAEVQHNVERALEQSPRLQNHNIEVEVEEDAVVLDGEVSNEELKVLAGKIAQRVVPEREVRNELVVTSDRVFRF